MEHRGQQHRSGRSSVRQQRGQRPPVRRTGGGQREAGQSPEPGRGKQQIPGPDASGRHPDRETEDVRCRGWQPRARDCRTSTSSSPAWSSHLPRSCSSLPNGCSVPRTTEPRGVQRLGGRPGGDHPSRGGQHLPTGVRGGAGRGIESAHVPSIPDPAGNRRGDPIAQLRWLHPVEQLGEAIYEVGVSGFARRAAEVAVGH